MAYDSYTKRFCLKDLASDYSDHYGWLIPNLPSKRESLTMSDKEIYSWIDKLLEWERHGDEQRIGLWSKSREYPCYGWTEWDIYHTPEEYIADQLLMIAIDYQDERDIVFAYIKQWQYNNKE